MESRQLALEARSRGKDIEAPDLEEKAAQWGLKAFTPEHLAETENKMKIGSDYEEWEN